MGARGKKHGLVGIKRRQPNKKPSLVARKAKLNEAKKGLLTRIKEKLAKITEIA